MKRYILMMALRANEAPLPREYTEFRRLWTQGEYFECHEVLETAWRREDDPARKQFLQGLIHCAVALVHVERHNAAGAARQLAKARAKLEPLGSEYLSCEVGAYLQFVEKKVLDEGR